MMNQYIKEILDDQNTALEIARGECVMKYGIGALEEVMRPLFNETTEGLMCPAYWDGILCWPNTPADTIAWKPCPAYIAGFLQNNATRRCMDNGVWFVNKTHNASWTNYTSCFTAPITTILVDLDKYNVSELIEAYTPLIKIISEVGYIVSLGSLIIAFTIMISIRKLHCARNILHMHLFASFMFRALIFITKDLIFIDGIGLPNDLDYKNGSRYFNINSETNNWACKLFTSLWQYFITANYSWILMEGLYLHNLIFRALFADSNNSIKWYVILGWGLPMIIVAKWIVARLLVEDTLCWTTHENYKIFLILAIPTMISILVNLVLFMRISMVLYSKLRSPINEDSRRYQKWVKSTLVLVPLFGVHYALFLGLYSVRTNKVVELIWLICDRLFGSFQGFFVAVLYCFLNGEVKAEIKPHLYTFLTLLATNRCSKHFFPCRKKFLRSVAGSSSICTTMSCSSLYTNGILHRSSKGRLDSLIKLKNPTQQDKNKDHICQNGKSSDDAPSKQNSKSHRHSQLSNTTETTLCIERNPEKHHTGLEIPEESIRMIHKDFNNF